MSPIACELHLFNAWSLNDGDVVLLFWENEYGPWADTVKQINGDLFQYNEEKDTDGGLESGWEPYEPPDIKGDVYVLKFIRNVYRPHLTN